MELLNLDALVAVERQVAIKGKKYTLADRSVGDMIESIKMSRSLTEFENAGDTAASAEAMFESMVKTAQQIVPGCPDSVLRALTMRQLSALMDFANASDQEVVDGSAVEGEAAGK